MKDGRSIETIIKSFRTLIDEIIPSEEKEEYMKIIFSGGNKRKVSKKVNQYFDHQIILEPNFEEDLNVMRDGVLYLLERIAKSKGKVRTLLYLTLFHKDEILTESEFLDYFDNSKNFS
jgi:hypothetical protein